MRIQLIGTVFFLFWAIWMPFAACSQEPAPSEKPKNIILMIGDGMGVSQLTAAMIVNNNFLQMERCTIAGLAKTWANDRFITDSGAAGTAIATGKKTNAGHIAVDPEGKPLKTVLEHAEDHGFATGLVVTCEVTHATPAAFVAHSLSRHNYEDIAVDLVNSGIDVFIGGGKKYFGQRKDSIDLIARLVEKDYGLCFTLEEVQSYTGDKLAGLLYDNHPPRISEGREGMLEAASLKALEILSKNENGFFLMIEGSQIDWGGHDNDTEYIVEEMLEFDRVAGLMLDFAEKNGETLVIITSDHETGGLAVNDGDLSSGGITTAYTTGDHTGVMVPVLAYGPGALIFSGIYENIAIFDKMMMSFGFKIDE